MIVWKNRHNDRNHQNTCPKYAGSRTQNFLPKKRLLRASIQNENSILVPQLAPEESSHREYHPIYRVKEHKPSVLRAISFLYI
uniref:Uncharacterized protein n=1 Tax=Rhizophora mucronata TaxID=61149 RepID=A0A2P2PUA2_RHIMU